MCFNSLSQNELPLDSTLVIVKSGNLVIVLEFFSTSRGPALDNPLQQLRNYALHHVLVTADCLSSDSLSFIR